MISDQNMYRQSLLTQVCEQNHIFIKVRHSRTTSSNNIMRFGEEDSELKADSCSIEKHYFKFKDNANITFYFFANTMIMSKMNIDHTNCT